MTLEEAAANIGRGVTYQAHEWAPIEEGEIVRVGKAYVFVLFRGDYAPKACDPQDLEFRFAAADA